MMQCPNCKKENADAMKFCIHCGKEIPKCPTCGKVIPVKMRFCPFDGVQIPENVLSLLPQEETPKKEPAADPQETIVIPAVEDVPKPIGQTPARAVPFGNISYCCRCGKAFVADGNKLCAACRNPVQPRQRPQQPPMRPIPPRQPTPQGQPRPMPPRPPMPQRPAYRQAPPPVQKKSSRGLVITLVVLLLLALLAIAVLVLKFVVFDGDKDTDRDDRTSHSTTEPTERETETPTFEESSIPEETTEPPTEETEPETTERPTVPPEERYDDEGNERLRYFIDHCTEEYFSESYFNGFDERTACIARNAIFARSGRAFDTPWIYEYFSRFDWYEPLYGADVFHNGMLNTYQQANLELIMAYEAEMGY